MRLILEGANFLLLDEPTNHPDLLAQEALQEALEGFPGTVLLVSHDRYLVSALASEVWSIEEGSQALHVYVDGYEEYLAARALAAEQQRIEQNEERKRATPPSTTARKGSASIAEVEARIQLLETELDRLNLALIQAGDDFQKQAILGKRYRQLEAELEEQLSLWERVAQSP